MKRYLALQFISLFSIISFYAQNNDTSGFFRTNNIYIGFSVSTNLNNKPFKFYDLIENDFYGTDVIGLRYFDVFVPSLSLSFSSNKKWLHGIDISYSKHKDDLEEFDHRDMWGNYNFNHTNITYGLDYLLRDKNSNISTSIYPFVGVNSLFSFFNFYLDYNGHDGGSVVYFKTMDYHIFNYTIQPSFGFQFDSKRIFAEIALNFNIIGFYYEKYTIESTVYHNYPGENQFAIIDNKDDNFSSFLLMWDYFDNNLLFSSLSIRIAYKL